jgi:DNA-binding response OmpR family regulator
MIRRWPTSPAEAALCWPRAWRLTGSHAWILTLLVRRTQGLTKEAIYDSLYADRLDGGPEPKIIQVRISQLRRQLKAHVPSLGPLAGIEPQWSVGYRLADAARITLLDYYMEPQE